MKKKTIIRFEILEKEKNTDESSVDVEVSGTHKDLVMMVAGVIMTKPQFKYVLIDGMITALEMQISLDRDNKKLTDIMKVIEVMKGKH